MTYKTIFHERLNFAMKARNFKQVDLVEKTKINKAQISEYISGKCKPKQDKLYLIAKALNVNPSWLLGFDVEMDSVPNDTKKRIHKELDSMNDEQLNKVELFIKEFIFNK